MSNSYILVDKPKYQHIQCNHKNNYTIKLNQTLNQVIKL